MSPAQVSLYPTVVTQAEFREIFEALQRRIAAVKMRTAAIVADAHAMREMIRRSRARRAGRTYDPAPIETFVKDRSDYSH